MKKFIAVIMLAASLCVYVVIGSAESTVTFSGYKLRGDEIEISQKEVVVRHIDKVRASMLAPGASIEANVIRGMLENGKDGKLTFVKGIASGGVVIHAKQVDSATKSHRMIDAVAQEATMTRGEDTIVLTGDVSAKITDPQFAEPATVSGGRVTIYLKEKKVLVNRSADKPAEITATPKEGKSN